MKLLHIDSSISGSDSISRRLSRDITARQQARHPGLLVDYLDLAAQAPRPLSLDALGFRMPEPADTITAAQRLENEVSETLVSQLIAADIVVIGAPMYNFTIPAQLKSWLDRVAQAGRTFKYTESGPVGLLGDKTVILALSRGGIYSSNPAMEHQESYLKSIFGFMGVSDIRVVRAEGMNMGPDHRERGLAQARSDIQALMAA